MVQTGPIIVVEDDLEDADTITAAIQDLKLPNKVIAFHRAKEAMDFLVSTREKPMVILCDVRMGHLDGLSFRAQIIGNEKLRQQSTPFVFLSGMVDKDIINKAYKLDIQGFFDKPSTYQGLKDHLLSILIYWQRSHHPG